MVSDPERLTPLRGCVLRTTSPFFAGSWVDAPAGEGVHCAPLVARWTRGRGGMGRWWGKGRVLAACVLAAAVAGCASVERSPVPESLALHAAPQGLAHARFWGDEVPKEVVTFVQMHMPNVRRMATGTAQEMGRPVVEYLALSGGADDGAFGAGLLVGWTKRGDRPRFEVVTGVSAGALIAPYAFLGPRYDAQLAELWTEFDAKMVFTPQVLAGLLGAEALADTTPLRELIAKHVNRQMLREIAQEYRNGRLLMIGTTNLDAQRQVIWNMGEIAMAAARDPKAAQLFRDVLLASSSIPGLFPPVHIKVRVGESGRSRRCTSTAAPRATCSWRRRSSRSGRSTASIRGRRSAASMWCAMPGSSRPTRRCSPTRSRSAPGR